MDDIHVTRELLLGVFRGELPTPLLAQVSLQHLLDLCPRCRREFEAFRRRAGAESAKADAGLVSTALAFQVARLEKEHRRAERDLRDLLALDQDERFGRIRRSGLGSGVAISLISCWRMARTGSQPIRRRRFT